MDWREYDPTWLVELAKQQYPTEAWFHESLAGITKALNESEDVLYFVDRMEGKFLQNVTLFSPEHGRIVVDVLRDRRIGGLEFLRDTVEV